MNTSYLLQDARGAYHPINGPTRIGRDPKCQIRLYDPEVSRVHALLWIDRKTLYIRDENSPNGTYLNNWRIPPEKPIALSAGSQVGVGQTIFTVVSIEPQAVQEPVATPAPVSAPDPPQQWSGRSTLILFGIGVLLCLGLLALAVGYLILRPAASPPAAAQDFPGLTILATSAPQPLQSPQAFGEANKILAIAVAQLNTAELVFIRQAGSG
jgi:pSer/pThr/pTyr-binding forkhead associated (FHA) protein